MNCKIMLGRNICAERNRANLSQTEVSDALGIDRATLVSYENGKTTPDSLVLYKLSLILNCEISNFYFGFDTTNCGE